MLFLYSTLHKRNFVRRCMGGNHTQSHTAAAVQLYSAMQNVLYTSIKTMERREKRGPAPEPKNIQKLGEVLSDCVKLSADIYKGPLCCALLLLLLCSAHKELAQKGIYIGRKGGWSRNVGRSIRHAQGNSIWVAQQGAPKKMTVEYIYLTHQNVYRITTHLYWAGQGLLIKVLFY